MTCHSRSMRPARLLPLLVAVALAGTAVNAPGQVRRDELMAPVPLPGTGAAAGADSEAAVSNAELAKRLARLERMLNDQSLSDFVLQLQQLQQEVQELRGQVELHQYQLRRVSPGLPQLGQSYAERQQTGQAGAPAAPADAEGRPAADGDAEAAAPADARAAGAQPDTDAAQQAPVGPPPKTGVGALGAGGDSGGTLALPSPETLEGSERDAYRRAFELLKDRDYDAAKKAFATMLVQYPDGQFADNGVYWLGEIGYVTKDYPAALTHFNRLMSDYPGSPKLPSAMLKLGYVYSDQQDFGQARSMLQAVVERFPDTTEGRLAQGRLEQMTREGG